MRSRKKSPKLISAADVDRVFDAPCIERLARIGKIPAGADLHRFAEGARDAARIYVRDSGIPTPNELHKEIAELHRAADKRRFERVAELLTETCHRGREPF